MVCAVDKAATQAWARIMEILGCPILKNPPLGLTNEIQRNASNTFGISSAAGAVDNMSRVTPNNFRSSIHDSGFAVRVCSLLSPAYRA